MVKSVTKRENYDKSKASFNVVPAFVRTKLGELRFFFFNVYILLHVSIRKKCYNGFELHVNIYTPREKVDFFKLFVSVKF